MSDFVIIDKTNPGCTSLSTEAWIADRCGEPLDYECAGTWMMKQDDEILKYLKEKTGKEYASRGIDNPYNRDNDFSDLFQIAYFTPLVDNNDWFYSDECYVAIERHRGGDVRGNYGRVELYGPLEDPSRLFDYVLGWKVEYSNGEETERSSAGEYEAGYSQHPFYHLDRTGLKARFTGEKTHWGDPKMREKLFWSERHQCYVGWYKDGRAVKIFPIFY